MRHELQTLEEIKTLGLTKYAHDTRGFEHTMGNYLLCSKPEDLFDRINESAAMSGNYRRFLGFDNAPYPHVGWSGVRTMAMIFEDLDDYSKFWFHVTTQLIGRFWKACGLSDDEILNKFVSDYGFEVDQRFRCEAEAEAEDAVLQRTR